MVVNDLGGSGFGGGQSTSAADKAVSEITTKGGRAVANYDSVVNGNAIIETAMKAFGRVDELINVRSMDSSSHSPKTNLDHPLPSHNAGNLRDKSFARMTDGSFEVLLDCSGSHGNSETDDWNLIFQVHCWGAFKVRSRLL